MLSKHKIFWASKLLYIIKLNLIKINIILFIRYYDSETSNQYKCHAAFELMIEPGSYEIGELLPKSSRTDCHQISSLVIPKLGTKTVLTALYFRFDRDIN